MVSVVIPVPIEEDGNFCWTTLKSLDINFVQKYQKCQICVVNKNLDGHYAKEE